MKFKIQILQDEQTAERVGEFLTSKAAFDQTWAPEEKALVMEAPLDSLKNDHHRYWYVEVEGNIIAAMGVRENKYGSGGYVMDEDYLAVHRDYRQQGIANAMLAEVEKFVKEVGGRYIHVLSCDIDSYAPARTFYERNGYKKVAEIPDYYVEGEGRIDFFKAVS
ncbi:MAG: GNAT family N-acetyltransferase [Patescibacteria group bacterium]